MDYEESGHTHILYHHKTYYTLFIKYIFNHYLIPCKIFTLFQISYIYFNPETKMQKKIAFQPYYLTT